MTRLVRIIEDEVEIAEIIKDVISSRGYDVELFNSTEDFFERWDKSKKALYLIDWNLPGQPGIEIVKSIRVEDKVSPIFIVSGYTRNEDVLQGLKAGADDYVTKPFDYEELLARVANAWEKFQVITQSTTLGQGITLLPDADSFLRDGVTVSLTSREYIIFDYLYRNEGRPVTREDLIAQFQKEEMTSRNIDVHVFSLRKKIKKSEMIIATVWGVGYKLIL